MEEAGQVKAAGVARIQIVPESLRVVTQAEIDGGANGRE